MSAACGGAALAALRPGRLLRVSVALAFGLTLAIGTAEVFLAGGSAPGRPEIVDFHAFHIAGRLAREEHFPDSYDVPLMRALQRQEGGGRDVFMPFVYPPAFGLVLAPLALMPVAPAFLLFAGGTLAFYLAVLRRLAGRWFALAALVVAPSALIDLRIGQNGLLTGGLVGLSAALALRGRGGMAGAVAGLLAFKPQVASGLALALLARRDGRALAVGVAVAVALTVLAVALLGGGAAVAGFRAALAYAGAFMAAGAFPLHRMTSLYACALSLGAPASWALAAQGVAALAALALAAATAGRLPERSATGVWIMSTAFLSPYLYDYDLPVFCAGLALALPALGEALQPRPLGALLAAVAAAETLGFLLTPFAEVAPLPSLGGPVLFACFGAAALALRRGWAARSTVAPPAAVPAP